jgi:hypothetical protein
MALRGLVHFPNASLKEDTHRVSRSNAPAGNKKGVETAALRWANAKARRITCIFDKSKKLRYDIGSRLAIL